MLKPTSLLYLIFFSITTGILEAQPNFSKTFLAPGLNWSFSNNLQSYRNDFLLTLEEYPIGSAPNFLRHLRIDDSGNILEDHPINAFDFHTFSAGGNITIVDGNNIYTAVLPKKTGLPQSFGLLSVDVDLDSAFIKEYTSSSTLASYSLVRGQGDSLIILADEVEGDDTSKWVASLTFYDTGTGLDTTISYKGDYHRPQLGEIKTLPNGDILMAFGAIDYSLPTPKERGFLQKISADGRLLWKKHIYPGLRMDFQPTLLPLPNGDIAYGWTKDSFSTSHPPAYYTRTPVAIFFLDSLGEFKSRTMLGPIFGELNNMELLANGDILGMGWKGINLEGRAGHVGWVFRLSPTGEKLWERLIAYPNITTNPNLEFYDAVETPNGDILLAGVRNLEENRFGSWLLKLGADGCYDPDDCEGIKDTILIHEEVVATSAPEVLEIRLEIFPNPATANGNFTVRLPAGYETSGVKTLSIFDVSGREVHRRSYTAGGHVVPSDRLAAGIYLVKVETLLGVAQGKVVVR